MKNYIIILMLVLTSCNHYDDEEFMSYISFESGYFVDTKEVCEEAKSEDKLVLFRFTGYGVSNRQMERVIFSKRAVRTFILEHFIVVSLAVDDKRRLPENLVKKSKYRDRENISVGHWNSEFQADLTNNNSQPYFAIMNDEGELIANRGYISDISEFIYFLKSAIEKQKKEGNQN